MYENQTFDTIIQRMLNDVDDDIDKREGSVIYTALAPIALELETYYEALDEVLTETFADTASYYYLAKRAAERNIYPIEATPSTLRMIADPPTAEIEVGDRFTSEDYELTFEVIGGDDVAGSYDIVCLTEGIVGNLESGTLIPVDEINGLESVEIQGAVIMMTREIRFLTIMAMKLIKVLLSFPELTKKMWKHFVKGILVLCKVKPLAAIVRTISIKLRKIVKSVLAKLCVQV